MSLASLSDSLRIWAPPLCTALDRTYVSLPQAILHCLGFLLPEIEKGSWIVVVKLLSYVRLFCHPMDYSLPGSSVHGILQAKILQWAAIFLLRGSSWPRDWTRISCVGRRILYHWATSKASAHGYPWIHGRLALKSSRFIPSSIKVSGQCNDI